MNLEVISRKPRSKALRTPLLFVHGAYVGAWCWDEYFLDWFAERGHPAHAVSLHGHGGSAGRDRLNEFGLADYAQGVEQIVAGLPAPPVLIGHSMGALVVQKVLQSGAMVPALVLACPVPAYGLLPSSFSLAFTRPALFAALNTMASGGSASPQALAGALFAGPVDAALLERCYRRMQRESRRALLEMSGWGLPFLWGNLGNGAPRPPTLVIGAQHDALIPAIQAESTARMLSAEYRLLPDIGHAVMLDQGWPSAAQAIADWLAARGL